MIKKVEAQGLAVLFVSHHLEEVFDISDTVTVMRDGHIVATVPTADLSEDRLLELMIGSPLEQRHREVSSKNGTRPLGLEVHGLRAKIIDDLDLNVGSGRSSVWPASRLWARRSPSSSVRCDQEGRSCVRERCRHCAVSPRRVNREGTRVPLERPQSDGHLGPYVDR